MKSYSFVYVHGHVLPHKRHKDQTREALTTIRADYEIIIPSQTRHAPSLIMSLILCLELRTLKPSSSVTGFARACYRNIDRGLINLVIIL